MQIKIEIDVKPEELRRFLGLPDVAGLQEDLIQFLRGKVGAASENFDPATFLKGNIDLVKNSLAWRTIVAAAAKARTGGAGEETPEPTPRRSSRKRAKPRSTARSRTADDGAD